MLHNWQSEVHISPQRTAGKYDFLLYKILHSYLWKETVEVLVWKDWIGFSLFPLNKSGFTLQHLAPAGRFDTSWKPHHLLHSFNHLFDEFEKNYGRNYELYHIKWLCSILIQRLEIVDVGRSISYTSTVSFVVILALFLLHMLITIYLFCLKLKAWRFLFVKIL